MTQQSILSHALHRIILEFIDDLRNNVVEDMSDKGDLMLVEFFFKKMPPESIMDYIIKHVLPWKDKIVARDANFFLEKKTQIFQGLPEDRINYFAEKCSRPTNKGGLTLEDKETIFAYFETMTELAEKYKKNE